jgi:hypothetical protein
LYCEALQPLGHFIAGHAVEIGFIVVGTVVIVGGVVLTGGLAVALEAAATAAAEEGTDAVAFEVISTAAYGAFVFLPGLTASAAGGYLVYVGTNLPPTGLSKRSSCRTK